MGLGGTSGSTASVCGMRKLTYPLRRWPRLSKFAIGGAVVLVLLVALANAYVLTSGGDSTSRLLRCPTPKWRSCPGLWLSRTGI